MSLRRKMSPFTRESYAYIAPLQAKEHRDRLLDFYGIPPDVAREQRGAGVSRMQRDRFRRFTESDFTRFASEFGATHLVLPLLYGYTDRTQLGLPLVYENPYYVIYTLEPYSALECSQYLQDGTDDLRIVKPCLFVLTESGYLDSMDRKYSDVLEAYPISFVWQGPATISMKGLSLTVWPLALQGYRGDFAFSLISDEDHDVIRISPAVDQAGDNEMEIQFGVSFEDNGDGLEIPRQSSPDEGNGLTIRPGQVAILSMWVRMSASPERAEIFIQDRTEAWERSKTSIPGGSTGWQRYTVLRSIRDGATTAGLGVYWEPKSRQDWLEIRDMRVYVYPSQPVAQP